MLSTRIRPAKLSLRSRFRTGARLSNGGRLPKLILWGALLRRAVCRVMTMTVDVLVIKSGGALAMRYQMLGNAVLPRGVQQLLPGAVPSDLIC